MIRAVGFDLGDTLIHYENVPLSWQSLYRKALTDVLVNCNKTADDNLIHAGEEVLSEYNTRQNPRTKEVTADEIFTRLLSTWGIKQIYLCTAKQAFFSYFQRRSTVYNDTLELFKCLYNNGVGTGILTDVPYGMDKNLVTKDVKPIKPYIDILLTSVEVGYRKPDPRGYLELANRLDVQPEEVIYVGNEQKDIKGANDAGMFSVFLDREATCNNYDEKLRIVSLMDLIPFFQE